MSNAIESEGGDFDEEFDAEKVDDDFWELPLLWDGGEAVFDTHLNYPGLFNRPCQPAALFVRFFNRLSASL